MEVAQRREGIVVRGIPSISLYLIETCTESRRLYFCNPIGVSKVLSSVPVAEESEESLFYFIRTFHHTIGETKEIMELNFQGIEPIPRTHSI